ncbi:MAG: ATP-binding protein, partial [Betaproteobacteria bacterium]
KEDVPQRREGRYSLSRLFFNFYLVAMGSFVAIAFFADLIISAAQRGVMDDYARRFMRGTITLIEDDLARYPQSTWQKRIKVLDEKFAYKLNIVDRHPLNLPPSQESKLNNGEIAIVRNGEIMYHLIRGTNQVLVIGPMSPASNPEVVERRMPLEFRLQLLTWSLIGVIFAVALWFWIRPIWRDLETLRQTARALGDGDFGARSPDARSKLFAPLSLTLNGMAERIQQLIAAHRDLSCGVSHELRTPIARLRFGLEMLSETHELAERARLWAMMEQDLDELDGLIDVSLTYARFEREAPEPRFSLTVLADWLAEEIDSIRILSRDLDIQLDADLPPGFEVSLDRKNMPYAFKNLLRNAIKYARSRIVVSAKLEGGMVILTVDDDGIGIPEGDRERVFSAFTRLDRSRDRATGGYGLGLAIVRRVLDMHGGTAMADASPLGGARFILSWPIRQQ